VPVVVSPLLSVESLLNVVNWILDAETWHGLPARENTARMAVPLSTIELWKGTIR
jgi:hypothetical protein